MTDIQQRLTDILQKHGGWYANRDQTAAACDCDWEGESWAAHVAEVITTKLGLDRETWCEHCQDAHPYRGPWIGAPKQ